MAYFYHICLCSIATLLTFGVHVCTVLYSHPDYEEKKHLHYREGTSRSRHHAPPTDHAPGSGEEDRAGERRKAPSDGEGLVCKRYYGHCIDRSIICSDNYSLVQ